MMTIVIMIMMMNIMLTEIMISHLTIEMMVMTTKGIMTGKSNIIYIAKNKTYSRALTTLLCFALVWCVYIIQLTMDTNKLVITAYNLDGYYQRNSEEFRHCMSSFMSVKLTK